MSIFQKINNLFAKKQKIEKEIVDLQRSCNHNKKSVRQVRERVDSSSPSIRYVCDECSIILGYPTQQEKDDFLEE
jgi:DNA-directed RNA polymerase subunit M/transcription elongation factor TFIIS